MKIAIIGAGVAGLSAGFHLAKNGLHVTIYEATGEVGGRVTSFLDNKTQDTIDNGQHLLIGAYFSFIEILAELKQLDKLKRLENVNIPYFYKDGRKDFLSSNIKNSPLGLLMAMFGLKTINTKSKLKTLRLFIRLLTNTISIKDKTVSDLLCQTKQSTDIIELLWRPLTLATLNTDIDKASMDLLTTVLKKGFLANGNDSNLIFGKVPLLELLIPQKEFILSKGGKFIFNKKIDSIQNIGNKYLIDYEEFDKVILASSFHSTEKLLNSLGIEIKKVEFSPIVSVYLWFDEDYFDFEFASFIGTSIQWVFNKRKIFDDKKKGGLISITISAADDIIDKGNNEIVEICINDLKSSLKLQNLPNPLHYRVFKERNATILASPDNEYKRPSFKIANENVYLAACFTHTKFPSTIEGAALSGKIVAQEIINQISN